MLRTAPLGLALVLFCSTSWAAEFPGGNCATVPCQSYQAPCQSYELVEKTIMVPTWVTETRKVQVVEYRNEQRQRTYTVCRPVAEKKSVTENYTVMVPETRTREERIVVRKPVMRQVQQQYTVQVPHVETRRATRRVCKYVPVTETRTVMVPETRTREEKYTVTTPVTRQVTQNYTVQVPYTETREGTRKVCRWVPVTERRKVCTDQGQYQDVECTVPSCQPSPNCCSRRGLFRRRCCSEPVCCDTPCAAPTVVVQKVWVPNLVEKEIQVIVQKQQLFDEKYTYNVTLCKNETRSRTVNVCEYVQQEKTRNVQYTVCVPKVENYVVNKATQVDEEYTFNVTVCKPETRTRTVTVCDTVEEVQVRQVPYTVCVPQEKTRTYEVTVWKSVPETKTETYLVQVPYCVEKEVAVQVCKLVPKKITCMVPKSLYSGCAPGCAN
jgi:hypothetical protein